jgi:Rieske Fe-S protein
MGAFLAGSLEAQTQADRTPLEETVLIRLAELDLPWQRVPFRAWCTPSSGARAGARTLVRGLALRTGPGRKDLRVYCLTCPHEICHVELRAGDDRPAVDVPLPSHPVLVCPCHASVFDPGADGARLAGPSHRGLFRFGCDVTDGNLLIYDLETAALLL